MKEIKRSFYYEKRYKADNCPPPASVPLDTSHLKNCYCKRATHVVQSDKLRRHPELVHLMTNNPLPQSLPRGREVKKLASPFTLHSSLKHKAAFTLAEVLITLGIIGVVAALTLPAVVGNYKKQQTIAKLKKAYSAINQALQLSEIDNGEMSMWVSESGWKGIDYTKKYWAPYFKVIKFCETPKDCGYENNAPYSALNGTHSTTSLTGQYRVPFLTSDGIAYTFSFLQGEGSVDNGILIDINGGNKPNTFGKDVFMFRRIEGKGIMPHCYNSDQWVIERQCSTEGDGSDATGAGTCCAQRIMQDGWKINYY